MDDTLILVAGLPGSGKTTHLSQMVRDGWLSFDDYKRGGPDLCFRSSPKFHELVAALRSGRRCAVVDIHFCKTESRLEAQAILSAEAPSVTPTWRFFSNDPSACEANIMRREGRDPSQELKYLQELSPLYAVPNGAIVLPVFRNSSQCGTENLS